MSPLGYHLRLCAASAAWRTAVGLMVCGLVVGWCQMAGAQITVAIDDSVQASAPLGASDADASVHEGGRVVYTVTAGGTGSGGELVFTHDSSLGWDGSASFSPVCSSCSCSDDGVSTTCSLPDLDSSAVEVSLGFAVTSPYDLGDGMLSTTASVAWDGGGPVLDTETVAVNGTCFREKSGITQSNICTAGDMTFAVSTAEDVTDGCVSADDTFLSARLAGNVASTTASRYDISMYVATDGGDAKTGRCYHQFLSPVTSDGAQVVHDGGPYWDLDGNGCGDVLKNDGDEIKVFDVIRLPCTDDFDGVSDNPDGFVDVGTCASYKQSSTSCDEVEETINSTSSKCICKRTNLLNVPRSNLACSDGGLTCSLSDVKPGWTIACEVSFANAAPGGTAEFIRFKIHDDGAGGTFSNSAAASDTVISDGGEVVWTPGAPVSGDLGLFPVGSRTLTFEYTVAPSASFGQSITLSADSYWAPTDAFADEVEQGSILRCSQRLNVNPTWVLISGFDAYEDSGRTVVEWETAAEEGAVGFHVLRRRSEDGSWVRVNERLLPASQSSPGGVYRLVDDAAPPGRALVYRLIEVSPTGFERTHGPFEVTPRRNPLRRRPAITGSFEIDPRRPSPSMAKRIDESRQLELDVTRRVRALARHPENRRARIIVNEDGLTTVSVRQIADALGATPSQVGRAVLRGGISLTNRGADIPWQASCEAGKGILFYGQQADTVYTRDNVYWLEMRRGVEMEVVTAPAPADPGSPSTFVDTLHFEQDLVPRTYVTEDPHEDYWFWFWVMSGSASGGQRTLTFELHGLVASGEEATLTLDLWGLPADGDTYSARVVLNDALVGDVAWSGDGLRSLPLTVSQHLLVDGSNTLEVVGARGFFFLDGIDVTFRRHTRAVFDRLLITAASGSPVTIDGFTDERIRVLEVTDPAMPRRLSGIRTDTRGDVTHSVSFTPGSGLATYLAVAEPGLSPPASVVADSPSDLTSSTNRGEYLVIAPGGLVPAAQGLADYRSSLGLEAMVVDLEDVMDEFNDGIFDPEAIRRFLSAARRVWQVPPRYVVLVGKGTYDYRDNLGAGGNLMPPLMAPTGWGLAASDNAYADVEGNDGTPEIAVGRVPAVSAGEVEDFVAKVIAYESSRRGQWMDRAVLAADQADDAGDFPADSDRLASLLPPGLEVESIQIGTLSSALEARDRLLAAIGEGAFLVGYVGHGGLNQLAHEGILTSADVAALDNGTRLPLFVALTCYVNSFVHPGFSSLGEELVLDPGGGAVAAWSSSHLSHNNQAVELGKALLLELFTAPGTQRLGDSVVQAIGRFHAPGGSRDASATYNLFGDPALIVGQGRR